MTYTETWNKQKEWRRKLFADIKGTKLYVAYADVTQIPADYDMHDAIFFNVNPHFAWGGAVDEAVKKVSGIVGEYSFIDTTDLPSELVDAWNTAKVEKKSVTDFWPGLKTNEVFAWDPVTDDSFELANLVYNYDNDTLTNSDTGSVWDFANRVFRENVTYLFDTYHLQLAEQIKVYIAEHGKKPDDLETFTAKGGIGLGRNFKDIVFVIDDFNPTTYLDEIVPAALSKCDSEGYATVAFPVMRSGMIFGFTMVDNPAWDDPRHKDPYAYSVTSAVDYLLENESDLKEVTVVIYAAEHFFEPDRVAGTKREIQENLNNIFARTMGKYGVAGYEPLVVK